MRLGTKTVIGLLTLGATGAVIFWRSQQSGQGAHKSSDEVRQRLDATAGSPLGAAHQVAHTQATERQHVHTQATDQRIAAPSDAAQRAAASVKEAGPNGAPPAPPRPTSAADPSASALATESSAPVLPSDAPAQQEAEPVSAPSDAPAQEEAEPVSAPTQEAEPVSAPSDAPAQQEAEPVSAPSDAPEQEAEPVSAPEHDAQPVSAPSDAPNTSALLNPIAAMSNEEAAKLSSADLAPKDDPDAGELDSDGDDRTVADRVRSNLGRQLDMSELPRLNINVQAGGVTYLRGAVQTRLHSELVEQVVRETDGVTSVVNELHLEEDTSEPDQTTNAAGVLQHIPDITPKDDPDAGELDADGDDRTTTARVLSQLGRELHADHLARINVNTQAGGVVYLRGVVQSQEQRDRIHQLVSGIKGVGDIVDELTIEE